MEKKTIVIAWTTQEMVHDGKMWAADIGHRPNMVEKTVPHACVWLRAGTEADVEKAKAYAAHKHHEPAQVFTYPTSEKDPIGAAKKKVAKMA